MVSNIVWPELEPLCHSTEVEKDISKLKFTSSFPSFPPLFTIKIKFSTIISKGLWFDGLVFGLGDDVCGGRGLHPYCLYCLLPYHSALTPRRPNTIKTVNSRTKGRIYRTGVTRQISNSIGGHHRCHSQVIYYKQLVCLHCRRGSSLVHETRRKGSYLYLNETR